MSAHSKSNADRKKVERFCARLNSFVNDELGISWHGSVLLIAFSGGVDSTALLAACRVLSSRLSLQIHIAHLDHCLREESVSEAWHARKISSELKIPFWPAKSDVRLFARRTGRGIEDAARVLRYRFLGGIASRINADWILTGHHLGDLAEDMLMRISRGSGWPALAGMTGLDRKRRIMRPLLCFSKEELVAFVQATGLAWVEDLSNQSLDYKRNRFRHRIVPEFVAENPGFLKAAARLWKTAETDRRYWEEQLAQASPYIEQNFLPRSWLNGSHSALRVRVYKRCLEIMGKGQALAETLISLDRAWDAGKTGRVFQFPGDKVAQICHDGIYFTWHERVKMKPHSQPSSQDHA